MSRRVFRWRDLILLHDAASQQTFVALNSTMSKPGRASRWFDVNDKLALLKS
jgi:hypothetical protein